MATNNQTAQNDPSPRTSILERFVMFFRRHFQCRFGVHWNMKYDSGLPNDICRAGTCLDCGYMKQEIKWTKPPPRKPVKCNSCQQGYDGTMGNGYQPCGCQHAEKLNPVPPREHNGTDNLHEWSAAE